MEDDDKAGPDGKETWPKLAIRLQVSRTAIHNWRKLEGAPQTPDYQKWREYIDLMELGVVGNRTSGGREELLKENLVKKNRLLDLDIAERERTVIDRGVIDSMLLRLGSLQKTVLYQKLEREMPAKAAAHGAAVEPMQRLGREIADGLCELFGQEMDRWQNST